MTNLQIMSGNQDASFPVFPLPVLQVIYMYRDISQNASNIQICAKRSTIQELNHIYELCSTKHAHCICILCSSSTPRQSKTNIGIQSFPAFSKHEDQRTLEPPRKPTPRSGLSINIVIDISTKCKHVFLKLAIEFSHWSHY